MERLGESASRRIDVKGIVIYGPAWNTEPLSRLRSDDEQQYSVWHTFQGVTLCRDAHRVESILYASDSGKYSSITAVGHEGESRGNTESGGNTADSLLADPPGRPPSNVE